MIRAAPFIAARREGGQMNVTVRRAAAFRAIALVGLALMVGTLFTASAFSQARRRSPPSSVRLYVFDGGTLESDPARYRLTKEDVGVTELSIGAYLIVHPKGVLMWDAGAVPDEAWTPAGKPVPHRIVLLDSQERHVTISKPLKAQLAQTGYAPSDATHLALSHYHWDHTANANAFARATWLVRQAERDAMFAEKPAGAVLPATYASLRNSRTVVVRDEEHDVFGDGTVILKAAPGHTPGHQVLYVRLAKTGGVLLSGDLYHYPQERTLGRLPTFEFNADQTRVARQGVEAFLKRTGAQLWIQHDFQADAKLKKAPAYYE
jgi:glyoxylase-like metal-dependent hydrolase (beta-lactamase superfamily II)